MRALKHTASWLVGWFRRQLPSEVSIACVAAQLVAETFLLLVVVFQAFGLQKSHASDAPM
jgi:DNA polymerase III psi subunit